MKSESCDVPIMLDLEGLTYEDVAKLNPFYEEYRKFWDYPRDVSDHSLCPGALCHSTSLPSFTSCSDISAPDDMAVSPLFCPKSLPRSPFPKSPQSPKPRIHSGGQYRPTFDESHDLESSHVAIVDVEECMDRPLSPVRECTEDLDPGQALDPVNYTLGNMRSSHKQLFGTNGWLGCTAELPPPTKPKYKKVIGFGKKLKQHMEDIATDMVKAHPLPLPLPFNASEQSKVLSKSTIAISLDPTTQAKLYSEIEVMICVSANQFLIQQNDEGRISKESIRKVNNFWSSKNRPKVVEFQFDQATQRQLILSNIRTMNFNGESSTNPVTLHSNLQNWKAVVKEMSVRTFCSPDSVIRKHMHDIQKLLDMLGAPTAAFLAFEELQMRTLLLMKEQRAKNYLSERGLSVSSGPGSSGPSLSPRTSYSSH